MSAASTTSIAQRCGRNCVIVVAALPVYERQLERYEHKDNRMPDTRFHWKPPEIHRVRQHVSRVDEIDMKNDQSDEALQNDR